MSEDRKVTAPRNVVRAYGDGLRPDLVLCVLPLEDGSHMVIIAGNVNGCAFGKWPKGFFQGDVPSSADHRYFCEKFGLDEDEVRGGHVLRVVNKLYRQAYQMIEG